MLLKIVWKSGLQDQVEKLSGKILWESCVKHQYDNCLEKLDDQVGGQIEWEESGAQIGCKIW